MDWFDRFIELTTFVSTTNPPDSLLENCCIEICVLHTEKTVGYPDLRLLGRPFDERVVVEAEHLDVWVGSLRELTDKRHVQIEWRLFGLKYLCDCGGHQVSVGSVDRSPVVK